MPEKGIYHKAANQIAHLEYLFFFFNSLMQLMRLIQHHHQMHVS